ncbi:MAG: DUF86 domain-containing protein [Candidatus Electrothrix aestuarii]|uniref:DUF86 domain-containing protein n=1 Tax=Candidatus Electrothrix aestuarii TaxID=3062594 RepID=A0AAU8LUJ9_9BACT|nr:DUF86 domain-containing protein [Candidatus Electrothrix aestuarii]
MLNGVITRKLEALEETLHELESLGKVTLDTLQSDWLVRRAVERDLQILVEVVIDVCHRLISGAGTAPASSAIEAVRKCVRLGVLSSEEPFRQMVQFRNFIVHHYERVDPEILVGIMSKHLQEFRLFQKEVLRYVSKN